MAKPRLPKGMIRRGNIFWADFFAHGRRVRQSLSGDFRVACELLTELRARANRGDFGLMDNNVPPDQLRRRRQYLRHCRQVNKAGTVRRYEYSFAAILPHVPKRASLLTADVLLDYRERRLAEGLSPRTINIDVDTLSRMLHWAVKRQKIGSNPIAGIGPLPHDHPKEGRALEPGEVDRLLAASPEPWKDVWYAFLVTGLRKSETERPAGRKQDAQRPADRNRAGPVGDPLQAGRRSKGSETVDDCQAGRPVHPEPRLHQGPQHAPRQPFYLSAPDAVLPPGGHPDAASGR